MARCVPSRRKPGTTSCGRIAIATRSIFSRARGLAANRDTSTAKHACQRTVPGGAVIIHRRKRRSICRRENRPRIVALFKRSLPGSSQPPGRAHVARGGTLRFVGSRLVGKGRDEGDTELAANSRRG